MHCQRKIGDELLQFRPSVFSSDNPHNEARLVDHLPVSYKVLLRNITVDFLAAPCCFLLPFFTPSAGFPEGVLVENKIGRDDDLWQMVKGSIIIPI